MDICIICGLETTDPTLMISRACSDCKNQHSEDKIIGIMCPTCVENYPESPKHEPSNTI